MRGRLAVGALFLAALIGAGCGGDEEPSPAEGPDAKLFQTAGCAGCHTLRAAGAEGTEGPDLDQLQPTKDDVVRQVRIGGNGMPSFADRLSDGEIARLGEFVASAVLKVQAQEAAEFTPDDTELSACRDDDECFKQAYGNIAYDRDPGIALRVLERRQAEVPAPTCHQITHTIGAAALLRLEGDVGRAFAYGTPVCSSGYYHGILERALSRLPRSEVGKAALEICDSPKVQSNGFMIFQCLHGLGHGLMLYSGYDLKFALSTCHDFADKVQGENCASGAFMENISSSFGVKSPWLKDEDPIYPCNAVAERDKLYCYLIVAGRIIQLVGPDWRKMSEVCRQRSEPDWTAVCFQSLGGQATGEVAFDPNGIADLCRLTGDMQRECFYGAVRNLLNEDTRVSPRSVRLCELAEGSASRYCFVAIGTMVHWLGVTDQERRRLCEPVGARYEPACLRGAGVQDESA